MIDFDKCDELVRRLVARGRGDRGAIMEYQALRLIDVPEQEDVARCMELFIDIVFQSVKELEFIAGGEHNFEVWLDD